MNTTTRSLLSAGFGLSLAGFSIASAFIVGAAAPATLVSFGLLTVYGLLEIAALSYQPTRLFATVAVSSATPTRSRTFHTVSVARMHRRPELARAA